MDSSLRSSAEQAWHATKSGRQKFTFLRAGERQNRWAGSGNSAEYRPSYNCCMRIASGKVVSGQVIVDGERLPEGAHVTVLAPEADETFDLDAGAEAELLESIVQADRGELIPAAEVLRKLRSR